MSAGTISVRTDPVEALVVVAVTAEHPLIWCFTMTGASALTLAGALLDCAVQHPGAESIDLHFPGMPAKVAAAPDRIRTLARALATAADRVLELPARGADAA